MTKQVLSNLLKRKNLIIAIAIIMIFVIGFTAFNDAETEATATASKNVSVQKVEEENYSLSLDYRGIVQPYETKNYAFLLGGKIEKIYVEKGQKIEPGDLLAKLDADAVELSRNTAAQNLQSLENSLRLAKSNLDAMEALYEQGAVASKTFEAKQTEYQNLLNSYEIAKNGLSQAAEMAQNAALYSDISGYVMELPFKEGEVAGAGYPVVICKSDGIKVTVGVPVDDYSKISMNSPVLIDGDIQGKIDSISPFPDEGTMLYSVDIVFSSNKIDMGETVDVQIITGTGEGCFIPLESVFNLDGIDYVYTVSEDESKSLKVNKQQVGLHEIKENNIRVTGLKAGTQVVTTGVKSLKENDAVDVVNSEGAEN